MIEKKPIPGFSQYEAWSDGSIFSLPKQWSCGVNGGTILFHKGKILKPSPNKKGYLCLVLITGFGTNVTYLVHRLIAETFIPNPLNLSQVNHKNGIKTDNKVENLEWCTNRENMDHALNNNLVAKGERSAKATVTEKQVKLIKKLYNERKFKSKKALARYMNVSWQIVGSITRNETWKHLK